MAIKLASLFDGMQQKLRADLGVNRAVFDHPVAKGDATEADWGKALRQLPSRYQIDRAKIVDSKGECSDFIDLVLYDRQYCPLLFTHQSQHYIPAESVYAVFEIKQDFSAQHIKYAGEKVASVRRLHRTSADIPHAGGRYPPKQHFPILGGILALDSTWDPPLGKSFEKALRELCPLAQLDLGCSLQHGSFNATWSDGNLLEVEYSNAERSLLSFFLNLFQRLQGLGTVPAIDLGAYMESMSSQA